MSAKTAVCSDKAIFNIKMHIAARFVVKCILESEKRGYRFVNMPIAKIATHWVTGNPAVESWSYKFMVWMSPPKMKDKKPFLFKEVAREFLDENKDLFAELELVR